MLALVEGSNIITTALENSWCNTPVGRVTATPGWSNGGYQLVTVLAADPVPADKVATSSSVQMVGGQPKEVHVLADKTAFDADALNAALAAPGSVVRALGLVMFDAVNALRVKTGDPAYTMQQFLDALKAKIC